MSDATAGQLQEDELLAALALADRKAYLEQRIFVLSPFGTFPTAVLLFLLPAAAYVAIAVADRLPILTAGPQGPILDSRARVAFILSLLMAVVLGVQRYVRVRERADIANAAGALRGGYASAARMTSLTPLGARLTLASLVGILLGVILVWLTFAGDSETAFETHPGIFHTKTAMTLLLTMSFARGVELTRQGSRNGRALIENELIIDLLRIDKISFLGRSAARFALVWFSIAAVSCLFFVSSGITVSTIGLMLLMAVIGVWTFIGMMERIHQRIRRVKDEELEGIRARIDDVRTRAHVDADAAQRLQGLLAYETRIAAAPEWPFDETTLMRLGASALILTVPWFGQAIAAYLIERLGPG